MMTRFVAGVIAVVLGVGLWAGVAEAQSNIAPLGTPVVKDYYNVWGDPTSRVTNGVVGWSATEGIHGPNGSLPAKVWITWASDYDVTSVKPHHCSAGAQYVASHYTIESLNAGGDPTIDGDWTVVETVVGNTTLFPEHTISSVTTKGIRMNVSNAGTGSGNTFRFEELEVYGVLSGGGGGGTWLVGYQYRKSLALNAGTGAGTGFQVQVEVGESSGASSYDLDLEGNALNFPNDIRFTDDDFTTELGHWLVETTGTAPNRTATFWVKVNDNLDSAQSIYTYYGKGGDTSGSDGDATFEFFDDFPGAAIDGAKWIIDNATGWTVGSGELRGQNTSGRIRSQTSFNSGVHLETKYRTISRPNNGNMAFGVWTGTSDNIGLLNHPGGDYLRRDGSWVGIGNEATIPLFIRVTTYASTADLVATRQDNGATHHSRLGESKTVSGDPIALGYRYDNVLGGQSYDAYWDWVFARKAATSDPTPGAAGAEESQEGVSLSFLAATDVTDNSATFTATLAAASTNADVYAHWGTTDGTNNLAAWANSAYVGSWTNVAATNISHVANSLASGTLYYYTFSGSNAATNVWVTPSASFSTVGTPSVDNAGGPTNVQVFSATLHGELTAGVSADGYIVWGTTAPAALDTGAWQNVTSLGTVGEGIGFSTNVGGLSDSTLYYYRCYVSNAVSSAWSSITNLTTLGPPAFTSADGSWAGVNLGWTDTDGETGYILRRSSTGFGGPWTGVATPTADTVSFTDTGVAQGTTYYYQIAATNNANGGSTDFADAQISAATGIKPLTELGILNLTANGAINPATGAVWAEGDTYRFAFSSSVGTNATSSDIADYNNFVQNLANASGLGIGVAEGVTWKAIASTTAISAGDNTATASGTGESIWLLNGSSLVADNYADLYGFNSHSTAINKSETFGAPYDGGDYTSVWTGSNGSGGKSANDELGAGDGTSRTGLFGFTSNDHWINRFSIANTGVKGVYGLSMPLTVRGQITIANLAASGVGASAATFNASVQMPQTNANFYVYWGTSDGTNNPGVWTHSAYVGSWTNVASTNLSFSTNGLSSGTQYYYTFAGANNDQTVWASPSASFITLAPPVLTLAGGATNVAGGKATLRGLLTAGGSADAYICWGSVDGGNTSTGNWENVSSLISANQGVGFSEIVSDIYYGIAYNYRVYATNGSGEAWSGLDTFASSEPQVPGYELTADGQTFDGYFEEHDGLTWLLIGRGREGWEFDTDGQGSVDDVSQYVGTTAAFAPACYSDAMVNDLLTDAGIGGMGSVTMRLSRASDIDGIVEYQDVRWTDFSGNGDAFTWNVEDSQYTLTMDFKNAPSGLAGATVSGPHPGSNSRDTIIGNDARRVFTWAWGGHNNEKGFSYGSSVNTGRDIATYFIWDHANNGFNHSIPYTEVYIPYEQPLAQALGLVNTAAENVGETTADLQGTLDATQSVFTVTAYWSTNNNADNVAWLADTSASNSVVGTITNVMGYTISASVADLSAGTTYYYTLRASNAATNLWATPTVSFGTLAQPVVTLAGGAQTSDPGSASLHGLLTVGGIANAAIVWGTTDGGTGSTNDWQNIIGMGAISQGVAFSNVLTSVYYGIGYHYRVYATNGAGEAWSALDSFSTPAPVDTTVPVKDTLEVHYDANEGVTTSGSTVTDWLDLSGNGRHLGSPNNTPTLAPNTLNGRPVIEFDQGGEQLNMNNPGDEYFARETFLVFRSRNGTTFGPNWGAPYGAPNGDDADRTWMMWPGEDRFWGDEIPSAVTRNGTTVSSANNFDMGADVGQYMVLKVVSGPNSGTQIRPYVVGTRMDGWADCFVDTAEIIAYSGTTSAGDEDLIGGYLAAKYGITTTYPAYTFGAEQPIVNTTVADLAASTATLTGELDATQSVYTVKVYYGPNDNANGAAWLADGAALSVTVDTLTNVVDYALNVPVTGLTPDATYYYAFLAQNEATNAWATPNESFATFPTLALSNLVATTVTHESATLNGRLIVEGTNADVTVYYGTSDGGTTPGSWDTSVFVGTFTNEINTDFSKSVSGLLSDQYYYYAFFATNGSAGAWGSPSEILLTQLHDPQAPVITGATAHFRGANLTWTDNAGSETAYLVRRSSSGSGGPYTQIASLAADTTSYNDTGGSQLSTYWYRIAATSTVTQSSTDFALAQTSVTTPPEPITQLGILNLNVNNGVNPATGEVWAPGDTYRYVFVSSTFADGTQVGSSYYDNFVQGLANASALNIGANEGVSWKALASFTTGDAHDHTDTNPNTDGTGEAIFMLNGTERIANDYADLWDGSIDTQIDRDENNVAHRTDTSWGGHGSLWTGSNTDGSRSAGNELGSGGNVVFGLSSQVNAHWINRGSQADSTVNSLLRGLSEPLTLRALITLSNLAVTDVTTNSATLNGNLQVPTTNAYITLYWGSTDGTTNKGSWDNAVDLGNWVLEDSTNLSHALSGLTAGADYYYTFYGSNDVLDVWASPSVFFSPLAVPTLNNNGGATAITAASASLNGLMTAGGTANGTIVWGTSAPAALNFGVWDFVEVLGTVNQGVGFTTNVSGLSPETTYYYRAYATNTLGEAWSAITNFTTPRTTHVYIGPNSSNSDQWNVGANWNPNATPLGPVGSVNVEVPVGKLATAWNDSTPAFTGDLTIGAGATVAIGWTTVRPNSYNALGTPGTSTIYMDQGASINVRSGQSPTIPQIQLLGDATYTMSSSTQPNSSPTYAHGIHGPYTFTLRGKSGCVSTFSASNSFAHFVADPLVGNGFPINANAAGSMGSGDITIQSSAGNTVAGNLTINAADAMSDSGTLSISGSASATKITMNANDTVASVVIDGVTQAYGTYGRTGLGGVDFEVSWIAGNGILTIPVPPSGYWDLDGTTAGAGGASPAGVWDGGTANWDSTADGTGAAKVWTAGEPAVFAAGSDANGTYTVNVSGTHDIGGLTVEEGTVTLSGGTLQLSADAPINVAGGLTTTVDSLVSDDGSTRKLTKVGTGSVALNGANSFAGIMRIEDGTVTIGTLAAAGANSGIGAYATAGENGLELAGGTLAYTGGSTTVDRGLTVSGNSILNLSAAGTSLTMGDSQGRDSSGTLTVTGGVGSSLSVGRVTVVEGVTLTLAPSTIPMTVSTVRGYTSYPLPHSPLVLSGASEGNVVSGNIFIENPPLSGFSRPIYVTKTGSGTWTLNGNNSNNRLTVEEGTIAVSSFNNSGATGPLGNNSSADTMGGAGGLSGTIRYTGGPASSNKKFSMATGGTGVFEVATSSTELTLSGVIEGGGVLAKSGAGTLYLTGANTYSGGTEVRGGTLGVAGTIGNLVTVNGGALSPGIGAAITTLTLSNGLTLESGGSLSMQIGTSSDLINVTGGTITGPSSGTVNVAVTDSGGLTLQTYVVIDWTGATPSDMDASDFTSTVPAGYRGWFEISGNTLLLVIIEETTVFMFR